MCLTIRLVHIATDRTGAGGVARVNQDDRHPQQLGLVIEKATQLMKRPAVPIVPLLPANRYPAADAREVLHGNPPAGVFGKFDDSLADGMGRSDRDIGCQSLFFPAQGFQPAFVGLTEPTWFLWLAVSGVAAVGVYEEPRAGCQNRDARPKRWRY